MSVCFYGCVTLDGYLADKNHRLDWLHQSGTVTQTNYESFYKSMDITIMGKRIFEEIEQIEDLSNVYTTTKNYVFTHTENLSAETFIPKNEDVVSFVKKIEQDKNIWIVGGNTILTPLLDNDMVNHMIIQIAPVLLGKGIPLFSQGEGLKHFCLEEVKKYGQFAELIYSKNNSL